MSTAYIPMVPTRTPDKVSTIITGNRLEPRARSREFSRSLRAEVRDAAWMLTRQWQLKEFRAENQGSLAHAAVWYEAATLDQVQLGAGAVAPLDPAVPLDAWVQAQNVLNESVGLEPTPEARLQGGVYWFRLLKARDLLNFRDHFRFHESYRLEATAPLDHVAYALESTMAEAHQLLLGATGKVPDGYRLYARMRSNRAEVLDDALAEVGAPLAVRQVLDELVELYCDWFARTYPAETNPAWSTSDLEYQFSVSAPNASGGAEVMVATGYDGAVLDWYSFNRRPTGYAFRGGTSSYANGENTTATVPGQEPNPVVFLPTEIQFAGSPNARWWEFEDRRVDFGQLTGDPSDFGRMLLQEFMFLYQSDWFSLPFTGERGTVAAVKKLTVTDVFGFTYTIQPAGRQDEDSLGVLEDDWGPWSMYGISEEGNRQSSAPAILISPGSVNPLVGPPVERVTLMREESTNLVWAVEQVIPNGLGGGMDGAQAANRVRERLRTAVGQETLTSSGDAIYRYQLETTVPENWIPLIPTLEPRPPGANSTPYYDYLLEQGAMPRRGYGQNLSRVEPRTSLLKRGSKYREIIDGVVVVEEDREYFIHESKVPPAGVSLVGEYRRARWYDGRTFVWYCYKAGPISPLGGSGLIYDQLQPIAPEEETAPVEIEEPAD